ncbi:hypothetical protein [Aidingimonas halophila]|uniref:Polysaccharide pyruvyl transferase n=1 Tax=Aidingimonas halophila TaxID=574349 RepID=A0A1H2RDP8_9GAMM|nr:hypothetical protein [Aidingimonas halophila]GHC19435.1 hypothetical protein GCM10008094_06830 [Aidingimonas halophila]SDW17318.1 hypothetical protein SAMN05443545_101289 [Aidingimonas halophila]
MPRIVNVHYGGLGNIGDEVCAPAHYLPLGQRHPMTEPLPAADWYIFGGGCLTRQAARIAPLGRSILWAGGTTERWAHGSPVHPSYAAFRLAGSRDWPVPRGVHWVPDPSCLSPLFDNPPEPTQAVVEYGHAELAPMAVNNDLPSLAAAIRHLARGETVVTSSYHGMLWASWLGRCVEVRPTGRKFYGWHYPTLEECRAANHAFHARVMERIHG